MENIVSKAFGGKIRVRVCGILIKEERVLLVEHTGLNQSNSFWIPPGGGVNFGEKIEDALKREFLEETGIDIQIVRHLFTFQHIDQNLHAVELFFLVKNTGGALVKGVDPELKADQQIIKTTKFVTIEEVQVMRETDKHKILQNINNFQELLSKSGVHS